MQRRAFQLFQVKRKGSVVRSGIANLRAAIGSFLNFDLLNLHSRCLDTVMFES